MTLYCEDVYYIEQDNEWCFFYDEKENNEDSIFVQNKVKKLIKLLNEGKLELLNMDIENELFDIL